MKIEIFESNRICDFRDLLNSFNVNSDIYFDPDFIIADAKLQKGIPEIFCATSDKNYFIYPYIKIPFSETDLVLAKYKGFYDIVAPYGYCGPLSNNIALFEESEKVFLEHAVASNIVSEFVRYHFKSDKLFKLNIENIHNRDVLVLDLNLGFVEIWEKQFTNTNRNLIRKMEKEGYQFKLVRDLISIDLFIDMYYATMVNAGASEFYFFSREFLHGLFESLGDKIQLGMVSREGVAYCATLFFICNNHMNYYLSARKVDSGRVPANNFALYHFVKYGLEVGANILNFGGGNSFSKDDSLFKFKSNFTKQTMPFHIGKRIHNLEVYNDLSESFKSTKGEEEYLRKMHLLHFYRI